MPPKTTLKTLVEGRIVDRHPDTTFTVELESGARVRTFLSGPTMKYYIWLRNNDKVRVEISPDNPTVGKVVRVYKRSNAGVDKPSASG